MEFLIGIGGFVVALWIMLPFAAAFTPLHGETRTPPQLYAAGLVAPFKFVAGVIVALLPKRKPKIDLQAKELTHWSNGIPWSSCRRCKTIPRDGARFCHKCGSMVAEKTARELEEEWFKSNTVVIKPYRQ